jgi:hypothetical protein
VRALARPGTVGNPSTTTTDDLEFILYGNKNPDFYWHYSISHYFAALKGSFVFSFYAEKKYEWYKVLLFP